MSLSNVVNTHANKTLGMPQSELNAHHTKALSGIQGSEDPALAGWYEQAYAYYNAVTSGQEAKPEEAAWQEFLNQMNWAYQQLWGAGGGNNAWGDQVGGNEEESSSDPFGGQMGPNGNIVYTDKEADIGFLGEDRVYDIFSFTTNIHIAPTSGTATLVEVMDESVQPAERVWKLIVEDKATGKKSTYVFHNIDDIEKINIMAANPNNIDIQVNDDRIEVGEFVEGGMADGGGIPEGADIDGEVATYDGVMGQWLDFQPPFGNIPHHIIHGDMNLSVKASDEVVVEKLANGGYEVTVTDRDGNRTTFELKAGFKLNVNAHPDNVTFLHGAKGPSISGQLTLGGEAAAPGATDANGPWNGVEGVPEGFDEVTLNGQAGPTGESNVNPDHETWPQEFKDLLGEMGIDWETTAVNLPDNLIQEIKDGVMPPSQDLLNALLESDSTLKAAWNNAKDSDSAFTWAQARNRLIELLETLFPNADISADGELPEGIELSELEAAQVIFFNDQYAYQIEKSNGGKIKINEFDLGAADGPDGTDGENSVDLGAYGNARAEEFKETLESMAAALGLSHEELLEKISTFSTQKKGDLWHILDYTTQRNFMPWDLSKLLPTLIELDPTLEQALNAYQGSTGSPMEFIRDRIVTMLQVLYPDAAVAPTSGDSDSIQFFGQEWDIIDQDADSSDAAGWLRWKAE